MANFNHHNILTKLNQTDTTGETLIIIEKEGHAEEMGYTLVKRNQMLNHLLLGKSKYFIFSKILKFSFKSKNKKLNFFLLEEKQKIKCEIYITV